MFAAVFLLQASHGLGAYHVGVASNELHVLHELVLSRDIDAVAQCAAEFFQLRSGSQIVISDTYIQFGEEGALDSCKGILQTRREAIDIGTLVEEVQNAVELGARAVEGTESFRESV